MAAAIAKHGCCRGAQESRIVRARIIVVTWPVSGQRLRRAEEHRDAQGAADEANMESGMWVRHVPDLDGDRLLSDTATDGTETRCILPMKRDRPHHTVHAA